MSLNKLVRISLWVFLLLLLSVIAGLFGLSYISSQLPVEARVMLNQAASSSSLNDRMDNPKKYQDLPCIETTFLEQDYCFDQSRVVAFTAHSMLTDKKVKALSFTFVSNVLNESGVKSLPIKVLISKTREVAYPENYIPRFIYVNRKKAEDQEEFKKRYELLIQEGEAKWTEFSELTQFQPKAYVLPHKRRFMYVSQGLVIAEMKYLSPTPHWQHTGNINYKFEGLPLVLNFLFVTNDNPEDTKMFILEIAQEVESFFHSSKVQTADKL